MSSKDKIKKIEARLHKMSVSDQEIEEFLKREFGLEKNNIDKKLSDCEKMDDLHLLLYLKDQPKILGIQKRYLVIFSALYLLFLIFWTSGVYLGGGEGLKEVDDVTISFVGGVEYYMWILFYVIALFMTKRDTASLKGQLQNMIKV